MRRVVAIGVLAAGLAATAAFAYFGASSSSRVTQPVIKIESSGQCVAPTEQMRRDHMNMLLRQRDNTVRLGQRETRFSLKGCVDCHASGETGSVLGAEGFCASCHTFASVSMDCFECHSAQRQTRVSAAP